MTGLNEFLTGLSAADTTAVGRDIFLFGNAFVERKNGKKRRVPVHEWPAIVEKHKARPLSDGVPGMVMQ